MNLTNTQPAVTHSTFVIERSFPVPPDRLFACFSDPALKRAWIADERGMAVESFTLDFRVGGTEQARYRFQEGSPFPGAILGNDTVYRDIVPGRRIVTAYNMSIDGRCFSSSLGTFEFLPTETGTDLVFTEQGAYFEGSDGPQMREAGWRKLLENLALHAGSKS